MPSRSRKSSPHCIVISTVPSLVFAANGGSSSRQHFVGPQKRRSGAETAHGSGQCLAKEFALKEQVGAGNLNRKRKAAGFLIGAGPRAAELRLMRRPGCQGGHGLARLDVPEYRPADRHRHDNGDGRQQPGIGGSALLCLEAFGLHQAFSPTISINRPVFLLAAFIGVTPLTPDGRHDFRLWPVWLCGHGGQFDKGIIAQRRPGFQPRGTAALPCPAHLSGQGCAAKSCMLGDPSPRGGAAFRDAFPRLPSSGPRLDFPPRKAGPLESGFSGRLNCGDFALAAQETLVSGMAGRYAQALFALCQETGTTEQAAADLAAFAELVTLKRGFATFRQKPGLLRRRAG